jgi:hypothetical protein
MIEIHKILGLRAKLLLHLLGDPDCLIAHAMELTPSFPRLALDSHF